MTSLRHVQLLGRAERRRILTEWNDTACVVEPATVPELFERKGTRAPEDLAVVARDARLTHAEAGRGGASPEPASRPPSGWRTEGGSSTSRPRPRP